MKHLNTYITEYIIKKKLDKPIDSEDHYVYYPETKQELIDNVKELFNKGETNLNCIDTSKITDMSRSFESYENINFDISKWNVSNVKDMSYMFFGCKLFDCDLSDWDVSNVENTNGMFFLCKNFIGTGLEKWDVSNIKNMSYMFSNSKKLDCNLEKWNIHNDCYMNNMLVCCSKMSKKIPSWYKA